MWMLQGTPGEMREFLRGVSIDGIKLTVIGSEAKEASPEASEASDAPDAVSEKAPELPLMVNKFEPVSVEVARLVLSRLPLSTAQRAMLVAIYNAYPVWLDTKAMQTACGSSGAEMAGCFGAFGRRVANTPGFRSQSKFFDWRWNDQTERWDYGLPETVREAMRLENVVTA